MVEVARDGVAVLVVDDHPVVRRGIVCLLATEHWAGQIVEAGTAQQARRLATAAPPALAVVDLKLPDGDGVALVRDLVRIVPTCAILVVTMTNDPGTVRTALDAGARGYLLKDSAPETVVGATRAVLDGSLVIGPHVHGDDVRPGIARPPAPFDRLTPRELQLVKLLAAGRNNREIARTMSVSEKTIRNQMSIITAKLGVADRVQTALLAHREGLTA